MKLNNKLLLTVITTICLLSLMFVGTQANGSDLGIPFDPKLYYGRSVLETMDNAQNLVEAYDEIVRGIQNSQEDIWLKEKNIYVTSEEINFLLTVYRFDNPQSFWVEKYQYYTTDDPTDYSLGAHIVYNRTLNTDSARQQFDKATEAFLNSCHITPEMSEYEISKVLHDKTAEHITYTDTENSHNIYGAMVEGKAVCEGYAELYQYLLYLNGISAHIATGKSYNQGHAWNIVRLDGKYYQTDVTWDDQSSMTFYGYFNITTKQMAEDHSFTYNGYPLPDCISIDASYFNHSGGHGVFFSGTPDVDNVVYQVKNFGFARLFYTGEGDYTIYDFSNWVDDNFTEIAQKLDYTGTVNLRYKETGRELAAFITRESKPNTPDTPDIPEVDPIAGDLDNDGEVTRHDAIYLLYHTMFSEKYPINQTCDFNSDSYVTDGDAVYLLYHTIFGSELYPL